MSEELCVSYIRLILSTDICYPGFNLVYETSQGGADSITVYLDSDPYDLINKVKFISEGESRIIWIKDVKTSSGFFRKKEVKETWRVKEILLRRDMLMKNSIPSS